MKINTKENRSNQKKPMEQISLKLPLNQLNELREYAKRKGQTPISYHIRQAIAEYLENHQ
jgi:predicted DNA-binding protein